MDDSCVSCKTLPVEPVDSFPGSELFRRPSSYGMHHPDGLIIAWGFDVQAGQQLVARLEDITPTVLHALGMPIPADCDGAPLVAAFAPDSSFAQRAAPIGVPAQRLDQSSYFWSEDEEEAVRERLRNLGILTEGPMQICLVSGEYPPENGWGGIATYTHYMARALYQAGCRVWVIARAVAGAPTTTTRGGVRVLRIQPTPLHYYLHRLGVARGNLARLLQRLEYQLAVARTIRQLDRQHGIDVVEYPDSYADGLFHHRLCGMPYVVRLHFPYFVARRYYTHETATFIERMERHFVRSADIVSSPSRYLATEVGNNYHPASAVRIVPNPIDTNEFHPPNHGGRGEELVVLYIGWLIKRKGVHILTQAIPEVLRRIPRARFVFLGADMGERRGEESLRERLRTSLTEAGCGNRVQFLDFERDRGRLVRWYQRASVCVFPSLWDNLPYTVMEAMACGRPIVASAVGGIPEMITDGDTGMLVPPGDTEALANALVTLLLDEATRRRIGRRARDQVETSYASPVVAKATLELYREARGLSDATHPKSIESVVG